MTTFEDGYNIADLEYNVSPVVKIVGKAKDDKEHIPIQRNAWQDDLEASAALQAEVRYGRSRLPNLMAALKSRW